MSLAFTVVNAPEVHVTFAAPWLFTEASSGEEDAAPDISSNTASTVVLRLPDQVAVTEVIGADKTE
jgi:hypothetical protein